MRPSSVRPSREEVREIYELHTEKIALIIYEMVNTHATKIEEQLNCTLDVALVESIDAVAEEITRRADYTLEEAVKFVLDSYDNVLNTKSDYN
ncbi:hypothetical protein P4L29_22805 [Bacillus cereus]|nr:hypothetical protein [Bacillus cereus]